MAGRRARGQSAAAPGYPAGTGGASTLSAPVPPDHGAGGQQSPGAARRRVLHGTAGRLVRDACPRGRPGTRLPTASSQATPSRGRLPGAGGPAGRGQVPGGAADDAGPGTARAPPRPATPRERPPAQARYQPAANAYGYDQAGYSGNGHAGGYGDRRARRHGGLPRRIHRDERRPAPARTPRRQAPTATRPTGTRATDTRPRYRARYQQRLRGQRVREQRVPGERLRGQRGRRERLPGG